jgi:hypothetical protein
MSQSVISPVFVIEVLFKSAYFSIISSWSDGVGLSLSTAQNSRGLIFNVVNVRSIIEPLVFLGLVIAPGSLLKIKL